MKRFFNINKKKPIRICATTSDFNLSDKTKKIYNAVNEKNQPYRDMLVYTQRDVKEFIRLLKIELSSELSNETMNEIIKIINKLLGDKLI